MSTRGTRGAGAPTRSERPRPRRQNDLGPRLLVAIPAILFAIFIVTSGEHRLSNYLLWQSAYSELVFSDALWPDFDHDDLASALDEYASRERRYGAR